MNSKERDRLERDFGVCLEEGSYYTTVDRFCNIVTDICANESTVPDVDKGNHLAECLARNQIKPWMLEYLTNLLTHYGHNH